MILGLYRANNLKKKSETQLNPKIEATKKKVVDGP
jgi:hypothetical protein